MTTIYLSNEQLEFLQSQNLVSVTSLKNKEEFKEIYFITSYFESTNDPNVFRILELTDLITSHLRNNE